MLYEAIHVKDQILVDAQGRHIPLAKCFDDETDEAILFIGTDSNKPALKASGDRAWETITVKVKIPGARMVNKEDYEKV